MTMPPVLIPAGKTLVAFVATSQPTKILLQRLTADGWRACGHATVSGKGVLAFVGGSLGSVARVLAAGEVEPIVEYMAR